MPIKIDSSALIYAAKIGFINVLLNLYEDVVITRSVFEEVVDKGTKRGYPDAFVIKKYTEEGKIKVINVLRKPTEQSVFQRIGIGEKDTIVEAKHEKTIAIIDDILAKKVANKVGVTAVSLEVVLLEAYIKELITEKEFYNFLDELSRVKLLLGSRISEILYIFRNIEKYLKESKKS